MKRCTDRIFLFQKLLVRYEMNKIDAMVLLKICVTKLYILLKERAEL